MYPGCVHPYRPQAPKVGEALFPLFCARLILGSKWPTVRLCESLDYLRRDGCLPSRAAAARASMVLVPVSGHEG